MDLSSIKSFKLGSTPLSLQLVSESLAGCPATSGSKARLPISGQICELLEPFAINWAPLPRGDAKAAGALVKEPAGERSAPGICDVVCARSNTPSATANGRRNLRSLIFYLFLR